jgi:hypothetical protein
VKKGLTASRLTTRRVVEGTTISRLFSSPSEAFVVRWILGKKKQLDK